MKKHRRRLVVVLVCIVVLAGIAATTGRQLVDLFREAPVCGFVVGGSPPVAPADTNYSFAWISDIHSNVGTLEQELRQAVAAKCEFAVLGGDFVLHRTTPRYNDVYRAIWRGTEGRLPVYLAIGNHDWEGMVQDSDGVKFHRFVGPTEYVFWYGSDAFVVFNDVGEGFTPECAARMDQVLSAVQTRARNIFLICHVPPIDPRPAMSHALPPDRGAELLKLAKEHKVAAMLCGHIHDFKEKSVDGVQLLISGGGGGRPQPGAQPHWLHVKVENTKIVWQAVMLTGAEQMEGHVTED